MFSVTKHTLIHVEDALALIEEVDELGSSILSLKASLHRVVLVSNLLHGLIAQLHLLTEVAPQSKVRDSELDIILEHSAKLLKV